MFFRLFRRIKVVEGVAVADLLAQIAALKAETAALRTECKTLRDEFEALDGRYEKLRGRFYNTQRGLREEEAAQPTVETREQLKLRLVRDGLFIPGRPARHT